MTLLTEIPFKQIHICGVSIYCDGGCDLNNTLEDHCPSPGEITEEFIDLDKELPIYDNEFIINIDYRVEKPTKLRISRRQQDTITLRGLIQIISDCVDDCGERDCLFIEGLFYNHLTKELQIHWGS